MMRNVALGAIIGFGVVVLILSLLSKEAPPLQQQDAAAPVALDTDAGPAVRGGAHLFPGLGNAARRVGPPQKMPADLAAKAALIPLVIDAGTAP
jgi:hypothetical protein